MTTTPERKCQLKATHVSPMKDESTLPQQGRLQMASNQHFTQVEQNCCSNILQQYKCKLKVKMKQDIHRLIIHDLIQAQKMPRGQKYPGRVTTARNAFNIYARNSNSRLEQITNGFVYYLEWTTSWKKKYLCLNYPRSFNDCYGHQLYPIAMVFLSLFVFGEYIWIHMVFACFHRLVVVLSTAGT